MRLRLASVSDYMRLVIGKPLGAQPGARYEYSNSGYVLLGAIIEKASGQDFYDYVREHIFAPAGMRDSFYHQLDQEDPRVATPLTHFVAKDELRYTYRLGRPRNATVDLALKGGPQGGAYVTADDLFRFETALLSGRLISRTALRQMMEPGEIAVGGRRGAQSETRPGLGLEMTNRNGQTIMGHNGGDFGVASIVYHYLYSGYSVIVLSNRDARAARVLQQTFNGVITRQTINGATPPTHDCSTPAKG